MSVSNKVTHVLITFAFVASLWPMAIDAQGRGGGATVPEVHIPPPAAPTPQPPQRAANPRSLNLASPVFGR